MTDLYTDELHSCTHSTSESTNILLASMCEVLYQAECSKVNKSHPVLKTAKSIGHIDKQLLPMI